MLFLLSPVALSLVVARFTKWALLSLAVAVTVPSSWLVIYAFGLPRENGDNQMFVVGVTALALLAWLTLAVVILCVAARRVHVRRPSASRGG